MNFGSIGIKRRWKHQLLHTYRLCNLATTLLLYNISSHFYYKKKEIIRLEIVYFPWLPLWLISKRKIKFMPLTLLNYLRQITKGKSILKFSISIYVDSFPYRSSPLFSTPGLYFHNHILTMPNLPWTHSITLPRLNIMTAPFYLSLSLYQVIIFLSGPCLPSSFIILCAHYDWAQIIIFACNSLVCN